jgi:hypothetical protein
MSFPVMQTLVNIGVARARNWLQLYNPSDPISPTPNAYVASVAVIEKLDDSASAINSIDNNRITSKAVPIAVQAGGLSWKKRPFLKLNPDYALKPLPNDERGYREAGFYEMVALSCEKYNKLNRRRMKEKREEERNGGSSNNSNERVAEARGSNPDGTALTKPDSSATDAEDIEVELLSRLAHFVPSYYGIINEKNTPLARGVAGPAHKTPPPPQVQSPVQLWTNSWLRLRDTTAAFSRPCVIDIKIGKQTYEPGCSQTKVAEERQKYPEQSSYGFRITGMNVYDPYCSTADKEDGYRKYDKHFGRQLKTRNDIKSALESFFTQEPDPTLDAAKTEEDNNLQYKIRSERSKGRGGCRNRVLIELRQQLKVLCNWFRDNKKYHFYSSSILFVYEGDENSEATLDVAKLRMIDFAHVLRCDTRDNSYLDGLYGVLRIIDEILKEQEENGKLRKD